MSGGKSLDLQNIFMLAWGSFGLVWKRGNYGRGKHICSINLDIANITSWLPGYQYYSHNSIINTTVLTIWSTSIRIWDFLFFFANFCKDGNLANVKRSWYTYSTSNVFLCGFDNKNGMWFILHCALYTVHFVTVSDKYCNLTTKTTTVDCIIQCF